MAYGNVPPPCPALELGEDGLHSCAFINVERNAGMTPKLAQALGVGKGCDAAFLSQ